MSNVEQKELNKQGKKAGKVEAKYQAMNTKLKKTKTTAEKAKEEKNPQPEIIKAMQRCIDRWSDTVSPFNVFLNTYKQKLEVCSLIYRSGFASIYFRGTCKLNIIYMAIIILSPKEHFQCLLVLSFV